ncbi:heterokaryon incompatibility protein-domain-containing protein [Dendryphion nanum]|uniref:Heterokaryon incompatibility protein-domain-containing protein n=1 Tax=Dendryphion nanum TaxID=256645 RepID=A0A9P9D068_9PLEO|nr:heterokaryon incompatibility protein-domain-containing protein [Dendryphion nanum]
MAAPLDFSYREPNRTTEEIRLLTINPSSDDLSDKIDCSIEHSTIKGAIYRALPYTWGDPSQTESIVLNGQPFLRLISSPIWIDAVCINQKDLSERSSQVARIRDIFAQAEEVLAWVGPKTSGDDENAIDLISNCAKTALSSTKGFRTPQFKHWLYREYLKNSSRWHALANLLERLWFSRVWIVQEVVVSASAIVTCGNLRLDLYRFELGVEAIHEHLSLIMEAARYSTGLQLHEFLQSVERLSRGCSHVRTIARRRYEIKMDATQYRSFYDIAVQRVNDTDAADPRDMVHAVQRIVDPSYPELFSLVPDYANVTVNQLYMTLSKVHIEIRMDLLAFNDNYGPVRPNGLPS